MYATSLGFLLTTRAVAYVKFDFFMISALMSTLKLYLAEGGADAGAVLICLQDCIEKLRACGASTAPKLYTEWFQELIKTAPDAHGIYSFISSLTGSTFYV